MTAPINSHSPDAPAPGGIPGWSTLLFGLLLAACSPSPAAVDKPPRVLAIEVGSASDADDQTRTLPATIQARHETALSFRIPGRVLDRAVEVGTPVGAGTLLARLDPADDVLNRELSEDGRRAAEIELAQAERDAARFARLGEEGALGTAEEERQAARAAAAAARLDQARHQLALAQHRTDYTELRAPFQGVITQLQIEAGLTVAAGQGVAMLADPAEREVVAEVPVALQTGIAHRPAVARPAEPGGVAVNLRLRELAPQANPLARTVRARFSLAPRTPAQRAAAQALGLGQAVDLQLGPALAGPGAPQAEPSVVLPAAALAQTSAQAFVYRIDSQTGKLARTPVGVLGYGPDTVRVSGLPPGSRVVAAGVQKLHEGMQVEVLTRSLSGLDLAPGAPAADGRAAP